MKIHEYQAKEILAKYGVAVPRGEVANTLEEASAVARKLFAEGASGVVVKAQIHAGGRGKGGGVKVARTREDAELHAKNILGMTLITHQTGPQGQKVQRLLIEETAAIDRELYLGIVLDRATGKLVFMASQAGGMEIEEVAAKTPEAIFKESIDPAVGFGAWQARKLAFALGLKSTQINAAVAAHVQRVGRGAQLADATAAPPRRSEPLVRAEGGKDREPAIGAQVREFEHHQHQEERPRQDHQQPEAVVNRRAGQRAAGVYAQPARHLVARHISRRIALVIVFRAAAQGAPALAREVSPVAQLAMHAHLAAGCAERDALHVDRGVLDPIPAIAVAEAERVADTNAAPVNPHAGADRAAPKDALASVEGNEEGQYVQPE